jgi:hypothetical protein
MIVALSLGAMNATAPVPTRCLPAALFAITCLSVPSAWGYEVAASVPAVSGLRIHEPDEVLSRYCVQSGDRLVLLLPGGASFELVTSVEDPAITNKGDGSFHPFPLAEVEAALHSVRYPLKGLNAEIFLLPYPRRSGLQSAAGPGVILLSPGVRELSREQVHAEVVHELGHVVHYALMPDVDQTNWGRYRELRGITDGDVYNAWGDHANRPHEIFAEDFRSLFGDGLANYSGSVENPSLPPPDSVSGLRGFMAGLQRAMAIAWAPAFAYPNPTRAAAALSVPAGPGGDQLDIFDVAGRRVRTLRSVRWDAGRWTYQWDGRTEDGLRVAPGAYLARLRHATGEPGVRLVVLTPR